jgi:hypothetical protein
LVITDRETEYIVGPVAVLLFWLVPILGLVLVDMTAGARSFTECEWRDRGLEVLIPEFLVRYILSCLEEGVKGRSPLTAKRLYMLFCFRRTKVCLRRLAGTIERHRQDDSVLRKQYQ